MERLPTETLYQIVQSISFSDLYTLSQTSSTVYRMIYNDPSLIRTAIFNQFNYRIPNDISPIRVLKLVAPILNIMVPIWKESNYFDISDQRYYWSRAFILSNTGIDIYNYNYDEDRTQTQDTRELIRSALIQFQIHNIFETAKNKKEIVQIYGLSTMIEDENIQTCVARLRDPEYIPIPLTIWFFDENGNITIGPKSSFIYCDEYIG